MSWNRHELFPRKTLFGNDYKLNDGILAKWGKNKQYYPGVIAKVNEDGTFDINFDDGDK